MCEIWLRWVWPNVCAVSCFVDVAELATDSIVLLFQTSEWMDTGAAGVQTVLAIEPYCSDRMMKNNG